MLVWFSDAIALEALEALAELLGRYLDRDFAPESWVVGAVHHTHPSRTYNFQNFIRSEARTSGQGHYAQSSIRRPGILPNSLTLWVMSLTLRLMAWAAINRSMEPIGCPFFSSCARTLP